MKSATSQRLDSCPVCGGVVEATAKVYLTDVVMERVHDEPNRNVAITSSDDHSKSIGVEVTFYCENDHELDGVIHDLFQDFPLHVRLRGGEYRTD